MSYLARLKALIAEKEQPREPTELTNAPSVGFVSDQSSHVSEDEGAIEERAGLAADRVPPAYLDAWARLNHQKPARASEAEWRLALDDGGLFLDAWGGEAAEAHWTPGELFNESAGLVWKLCGTSVEAIGAVYARLSDGRILRRSEMRGIA